MKSVFSNDARFKGAKAVLATAGVALLLAACSPAPAADQTPAGEDAPTYVATVSLKEGQTPSGAEAALGGRLVAIGGQAADSGLGSLSTGSTGQLVFLAFDHKPLGTLSNGEYEVVIEDNVDRFLTSGTLEALKDSTVWAEGGSVRAEGDSTVWAEGDSTVWAEGDSTVWAEGDSTVWAEGDSTVWAEGDFKWMPPNTDLWNSIELREAHRQAHNFGNGVIVAVIDTGVDVDHPWLHSQLAGGWDFVDDDDNPADDGSDADASYGHGTSIVGIIRQIAPRATILPIRALSADGSGDVIDVVRAVYYAVEQGADIINLSLGGPEPSFALNQALGYAAYKGVFITTSAGNEDRERINHPGALAHLHNNMISVTSVGSSGLKSGFANYHWGVEISAPGEMVYGPFPENRMAAWSGTSMAAPVVAGAIALALAEELDVDNDHELVDELFDETSNVYVCSNNQYRNGRQLGAGILDIADFLDEVLR